MFAVDQGFTAQIGVDNTSSEIHAHVGVDQIDFTLVVDIHEFTFAVGLVCDAIVVADIGLVGVLVFDNIFQLKCARIGSDKVARREQRPHFTENEFGVRLLNGLLHMVWDRIFRGMQSAHDVFNDGLEFADNFVGMVEILSGTHALVHDLELNFAEFLALKNTRVLDVVHGDHHAVGFVRVAQNRKIDSDGTRFVLEPDTIDQAEGFSRVVPFFHNICGGARVQFVIGLEIE